MIRLPLDDPGTPVLDSPTAYLTWVAKGQRRTLVVAVLFGVVWLVSQALFPAVVGRAIDQGIIGGDLGRLALWCAVLVGLVLVSAASGAVRHRYAVTNWMQAAFRSAQLVGHHAADTGESLTRTVPTGDVVAVVSSDAMRIGGLYDVFARFAGAVVSYVVVALVLLQASTPLGLVVLIGVPVLVGALAFVVRPLQRRQLRQREEAGTLIGLGADTVAGLRVLRGIGGEHTFLQRYRAQSQAVRVVGNRVAGYQAALDAAQVLLPGVFVLIVVWLGARFAVDGQITPGQLVAFYGYTAFLVIPLRTATEMVDRATRAHIGAGKLLRVLRVRPDQTDRPDAAVAGEGATDLPAGPAALYDPVTGARIEPGRLTAVVSARPEDSAALADRLGRFGRYAGDVRLGDVRLADAPLAQVRRRIVVSEHDPRLFTGTLRDELDPTGRHDDADLLAALDVASGGDVLEALPGGLDGEVEERGRAFSGGQRQRLALARALLTDADTLVLVEPTSAVDAHTEARVAARLAAARAGRTTVVMTVSPLVLDQADEVLLLESGRVVATGTHHRLMSELPAYRRVVVRGEDD
ncbi:ABC transporter transmembrane domain-containing protein [Terracoccus luteus]|uniref:ABC-type multidrug transport system fused ATPase/permease subunit n=1 Tax=Terracoccus luteus TaxID=53356 RepID=A0A839PU85_9MICO|nr:ABC transporter ATP-binding protein [Terracoccus luteus]MBB2985595.1 ABC-type multidrug transport system fused ATPase/permease subunit [Terracoccus luteus]MCP2171247.1 ABC-type multidrug transport system fused ATPase/permease subunit [Terracoccus luteus]